MLARIRHLLTPPVFDDPNQTRVANLLNYILLVLLFLTLVYIFISVISTPNETFAILILTGLIGLYIGGLFLLHRKRVRLASQIVTLFFWLAALSFALLGGGVSSVSFNAQLVVILLIALLLGRREVIAFTVLSVLADVVLVYVDGQGLIPAPVLVRTPLSTWVLQAGFLIITGVILYAAVHYFNNLLARARRDETALAERNYALQAEVTERNRAEAALRTNEASALAFQERLRVLHELSIELTKTDSFDELCRKAVELGRERLGFDRLGIWFFDDASETMRGTYGIDAQGNVRDERRFVSKISSNALVERALREELSALIIPDAPLYEPLIEEVGRGWNVLAMMMDGDKRIGWIAADNLLQQRSLTDTDVEILKIYGVTLGHLTNRKRLEEAALNFQLSLKTLNQIGIELSKTDTLDELCRQAVEIGRTFFGFDRMGIWLFDDDPEYMVGTFGTDEFGETRDERGIRLPISAQGDGVLHALENRTSQIFRDDEPVLNHYAEKVGTGNKIFALLWSGDKVIGSISVDNLLTHHPITNYDLETLTLYGSLVGHLITRVRTEATLRNERNLLRTIIDTTNDIIFIKDLQSRFMLVNKTAWLSTPGVTNEVQMIGKSDFDIFPQEKAAQFRADDEEIFRTGQPVLNKEELGREDGENAVILLTSKTPLLDDENNIVGLVGVSRDITERKKAEAILHEREERLRLATHSAKIGTWDWRPITNQMVWSDYTNSLFGLAPGEFSGTLEGFMALVHPLDFDSVAEGVQATLEEGKPLDVEYRVHFRDGQLHWLHSQAEVYYNESGRPTRLIGIVRDITEHKQSERERLELALQKERFDLLTEFIGNMSHDLKTPLSIIKTSLYLLERFDDPVRQKAKIETIKIQTQLLEKLIQDVLTMSRLDHGAEHDFEAVDLNRIIYDVESKLRPTVERKHLSTRLYLDDSLPSVLGSEDELGRMLTNLLENALNYTPEHGAVTVRTCREEKMAVIEVCDTGIGIHPDDMPHIFDRFYRADPARSIERGGTGLGLAIVKRIVDMHGGNIDVESYSGEGSTFRVSLNLNP